MFIALSEIRKIDAIEDKNERMLQGALYYASRGIKVVPLRPDSKILPPTNYGISYPHATCKEKTIEKWFGPGGKFQGWNVGIACGGGNVFVVDVDVKDPNKNGKETLEKILDGEKLIAPKQKTPSGGEHYVFQSYNEGYGTTDKIGPGIDTRGGPDEVAKGHIAAWPSEIEGERYEWVEGGDFPDAPDFAVSALGQRWDSGRGNENVEDDHIERQWSILQIQDMLIKISPDELSYDEWLMVGQAVHSQHPNQEGLALWQIWSEGGERYENGECSGRWGGFRPDGSVRMGSLIYFAKQHGWEPDPSNLGKGDFSDLVEELNAHSGFVVIQGKVKVAHSDEYGVHIMDRSDYHALFANKHVMVSSGRGVKKALVSKIWESDENRRECRQGIGFFPNEDLWYKGYVNLWQGWGVDASEDGSCELWKTHIRDVICKGNEDHFNYVMDWMADMVQDPMNPKGTAIVMSGIEGSGKGTLVYPIGKICGNHYLHITQESHLVGKFNAHMLEALLVFGDEVTYGGSRKTAGQLKALVTERNLVCERKGIDSFSYENRVRLVVASNEDWFIPAGPESRRYFVLGVDKTHANDRSYFDALYSQLDSGGTARLMWELQRREIKSNLSFAPVTEELEIQRSMYVASGDPINAWVAEAAEEGTLGVNDITDEGGRGGWPERVDRMDLYKAFVHWNNERKYRQPKGTHQFYNKLRSWGFNQVRGKADADGVRRRHFIVPELAELRRKLKIEN